MPLYAELLAIGQDWLARQQPPAWSELQQAVASLTSLGSWWMPAPGQRNGESPLSTPPGTVDRHLALMALRTGQPVHRHQLAQWGWASSYVPVKAHGACVGLLVLDGGAGLSRQAHLQAMTVASLLCLMWVQCRQRVDLL